MVGVILLCAVAGAVVLTVTAGARRTSSSLDRLADTTGTADVVLDVSGVDHRATEAVMTSPQVATAGEVSIVYALIDGVDHDLGLFIPHDSQLNGFEHDRVLRGRLPAADRDDEVSLNELAAQYIGADVGDQLTINTLTPEQIDAESYYPPEGPALDVRVVGVTRGPDDLVANGDASITASPALMKKVEGKADVFATFLGIQLVPGATSDDFENSLGSDLTTGLRNQSVSFDTRTKPARDAIDTIAAGLAVFAIVAALASIVVVGLAVGRHLASTTTDQDVLAAIGMSPAARFAGLVLLAAPIAVVGAVLAVVGAVVASPVMPIGLARKAEPDPGVAIDFWVVLVGFVLVAVLVWAAAAFAAWRIVRSTRASHEYERPSRSRAAVTRSGAGPTVATGVELAFDNRRPAIPSRSAVFGVTVAVMSVIAAVTFAASLDRMLASPARWGYSWQLELDFTSRDVEAAADKLAADPRFDEVARWDSGFSYVDGSAVRAWGLTPMRGDFTYTLRSGRQPTAENEVVLGPDTASDLHVGVGDEVSVAADPTVAPKQVRVVGIALFPQIDVGDLTNGAGYDGSGFRSNAKIADQFDASAVVLGVAPGVDPDALAGQLIEQYGDDSSNVSTPAAPAGVGNLTGVRSLPRAIAIFVIVLGVASLAHALATTVRRRRHYLATLRSLGLTPRQTTACIVWQAIAIAAAALILGVPLGLILGRGAWWATADPIGVRTDISRPFGALGLVCVGTVAMGIVLAFVVAWPSRRSAPATALRTE